MRCICTKGPRMTVSVLKVPNHSPLHILLIEDNDGDALLIRKMLERVSPSTFTILHASTLEMAEPEYQKQTFHLLLLDMNLPGISGMEAVEKLRRDLPYTPLIVMTGLDDEQKALGALQLGAQDYIVKGHYGNNVLPRAIRYAVERKRYENKVVELVHFDRTTGLINRDHFMERLADAIAQAKTSELKLGVMLLALRRFKEVTATLGHEVGQGLLKAVGTRLKECLQQPNAIARLEGDEFALQVTGPLAQPENLARFAMKILNAIEEPFEVEKYILRVGGSIGIATFPECGQDRSELLTHADSALHRARQNMNSTFQFYNNKLNHELNERVNLEKELRQAAGGDQFVNHYQPIVDLSTGQLCGMETLLRWQHPDRGMISPAIFIPLAEKSDCILYITESVISEAFRDFHEFSGDIPEQAYISINLSARNLQQRNFMYDLRELVSKVRMKPSNIAFELTEGMLMQDPDKTIKMLRACREYGASILVDDFGTGYSSLSYLSRLPLDILKLDRSFVSNITTNRHNMVIATATINMAHALGLKVVAEGIENRGQYELLKSLGCDSGQGYFISKPMPKDEFRSWLTHHTVGTR
ncbi:MAG: GGDEF domain-containing response regulator [Proteobacteria bacterium]|nr:GGDEF domain-containing response regulator [Pseudomonadota bacterium]